MITGQWYPTTPQQITATRSSFRRIGGLGSERQLVRSRHRAYRGYVIRTVEGSRRPEYDNCGHEHAKASAARKCAERLARRLNRTQP